MICVARAAAWPGDVRKVAGEKKCPGCGSVVGLKDVPIVGICWDDDPQ